MNENRQEISKFGPETMTQYWSLSNELRFYADQRFKIVGAFLIANGLLANVAKDYNSIVLGLIAVILCYLSLSWEKKTTQWWGCLIEALKRIEAAGTRAGALTPAYQTYLEIPPIRLYVRPSTAIKWIYLVFGAAWFLYIWHSWPSLWEKV